MMFKTLIILYALSFWVTECTPNPGRSFPHSPLAGAAAEADGEVAATASGSLAPRQKQRRLLPKRPRLDLCAMHGIKNTAMQNTA